MQENKIRISIMCVVALTVFLIVQPVVFGADTGTVTAVSPKKGKSALSIIATVDKPKITIGDKITYTVVIAHDRKIKATLPDIADTLQQFELKDYEVIKPKRKRGKLVHEFRYLITTFTTGEFKISSFTVNWVNRDGEKKESKSGEISIFVESVKASETDKDDIRDIKATVGISRSWLFYSLWFGIPVLILIGFSVYYFTRKAKESGFFTGKEPKKPADELAYERLEKLKGLELIEKGDVKQHYIILSEIIRKYMESRYSITVLDMTTYELYRQLRIIGADKKHTGVIKDFLDECDMVKFAKYIPEEKILNENFQQAKTIVDITKSGLSREEPAQGAINAKQVKQ